VDKGGKPRALMAVLKDITERKRAEMERTVLQEQLHQSQRMEAIGQLAGDIAHDFGNLLSIIKGYTNLSFHTLKEDDPLQENIKEIQKATERATALVRQLLDFSHHQVMEMKVLDLNTLLRDLDKMLHQVISEDIKLVMRLAEDLGKVKVDPKNIEQVILNLVVNARDAMPSGGRLFIETANVELDEAYARIHIPTKPGFFVMLSVSDTGDGMTPEVKERIFEPFFTTKENGKGTGLGLSTVYRLIKQSRGNIWVYSKPGKGTKFEIYLPRVDESLKGGGV
jgi:signal transduction histidine kinase